jgi:hypothetical protein
MVVLHIDSIGSPRKLLETRRASRESEWSVSTGSTAPQDKVGLVAIRYRGVARCEDDETHASTHPRKCQPPFSRGGADRYW